MFSREKLRKILTTHEEEFTKNSIKNNEKFNMNNSIQSIDTLNKKLNIHNNSLEKSWKKTSINRVDDNDDDDDDGGKINDDNKVDGGIYNNSSKNDDDFIGNDKLMTGDYYSDDNNMIVGAVTLRNPKTPIENINLHDMDFSFLKKNKNYATEEAEEKSDGGDIKNSTEDTFHRAVSPILFLGQCFALMPVMNVLDRNPKRLKFSYKSMQVIIFLFFMCSSSILTLTQLKYLVKVGINAKNLVGLVFFSCVQCSCALFASLATRWPKMIRYWTRVESTFTHSPYVMPKRRLASRVRFAAYSIIFCSAVEHGLYLASAVVSYRRSIKLCAPYRNYTQEISFEDYVRRNYDYVFQILNYNIFVGIFILVVNGACTFTWNYMDLFIMMISKGLAYRFEQLTTRINKLANKEVPEAVFIEIREHYVKLCELLEYIDENLSGIILLSCMNNLYFVCYQLLNVFNKLRWPINYIYFWYSLLYLIGRTAFVFLSAASINDQAKGGLAVLRKVSSRTWCVEVERLIFQMSTQTVALSGKKFYYLTRRLLFGMAGTIVTYELVLLQFDEPNRVKGLPDLCA